MRGGGRSGRPHASLSGVPWTVDQVLALASDGSVARAGRELASPRKWRSTGANGQAVWGECQGSAAEPYRVTIDLAGPAYRCTCPSRKLPCKHALGLFLAYAGQADRATTEDAPTWVTDWLAGRTRSTDRAASKAPKAVDPVRAAADQEKRVRRREERITQGVDDLERWLHDLLRTGLAETAQRSSASFEQMAARLVDAQAAGLARFVRELAILPHISSTWPERMLVSIGRLGLLIEAWRRQDALDPDLRAEVRSLVGIPESREDVLETPPVHDRWDVLGRRLIDGDRLRVQRTWLRGATTQRWALVLDFSAGPQPLDSTLVPGTSVTGALHFYSGALPMRALAGEPLVYAGVVEQLAAVSIGDALRAYAEQLARNPWLERAPLALHRVYVRRAQAGNRWAAVADDGRNVPLAGESTWHLAALSGGHPVDLFGEWDGYSVWPLSVMVDGRCVPLRTPLQLAA